MTPEDPFASALAETRRATRDQVTAIWQSQMDHLRDAMSRDWREQVARIIDQRFTEFETALKPRLLDSRREVVRSFGHHWHDSFLCMIAAATDREWCDSLLDAAAGLCRHCAFFSVKAETIHYQGSRGYESPLVNVPTEVPIQAAAAFLEVVLSGIAAETRRSAWDLSAPLAFIFGDPEAKALLVPISNGERVVGVLYVENAVEPAAIEALGLVAGILLSRRMDVAEPMRPSSVVKAIASDTPLEPVAGQPAAGSDPRAVHSARVTASRLLLDHYATVKAGQAAGDVYTLLKSQIDEAREKFDYPLAYLDAEILRMLAQGKPELMRR